MNYENIKFQIENGVALLTLNRPDKLNSFTQAMHLEVRHALAAVQTDPTARVLVLTGAGRGFCAGQDLNEFGEAARDIAGRQYVKTGIAGAWHADDMVGVKLNVNNGAGAGVDQMRVRRQGATGR